MRSPNGNASVRRTHPQELFAHLREHIKVRLDDTTLPSLSLEEERDFGFYLKASSHDTDRLYEQLAATIPSELVVRYRVVTETAPGETLRAPFASVFSIDTFSETILPLSTSP